MKWARGLVVAALALATGLGLAAPAWAAWEIVAFPRTDVSLRAVAVTGPNSFQASGSKGAYGVTADGGRTWRMAQAPGGEGLDFRGLVALDPKTTILMSAGDGAEGKARLFRTADGGATWCTVFETQAPGAFFDGLRFWDRKSGLVFGDPLEGAWYVLRTRDGGRTWARVQIKSPPLLPGEAAFAASNASLVLSGSTQAWILSGGASEGGRAFRSRDRGATWSVATTPVAGGATGGVFGGLALSGTRMLIVGGDHKDELRASPNIAVTADGGATWSAAAQTGTVRLLEAIGRLDAKTLLAVGPKGTSVSHDQGRTWVQADPKAFHAIACVTGTCVAVGAGGRVGVWRGR
jgi:photosystem II stability/assembly factor-like uncharacterized protein